MAQCNSGNLATDNHLVSDHGSQQEDVESVEVEGQLCPSRGWRKGAAWPTTHHLWASRRVHLVLCGWYCVISVSIQRVSTDSQKENQRLSCDFLGRILKNVVTFLQHILRTPGKFYENIILFVTITSCNFNLFNAWSRKKYVSFK